MKIASIVSRYLLGLVFLVFGLNGFLHFIPMPPPPAVAGQFMGALFASHYAVVIFLLQLIPAVLLLVNRYVALGLTLLGPVVVNIFFYHLLMDPGNLPMAIVLCILWMLTAWPLRSAFRALFHSKYAPAAANTL